MYKQTKQAIVVMVNTVVLRVVTDKITKHKQIEDEMTEKKKYTEQKI